MSARNELDGMESTYDALIAHAQADTDMPHGERSSRDTERGRWFGGASWDESVRMATHGDIKGAEALRPAILAGATKMRMELGRMDPVYRLDEGHWIDVSRYVKGEPECWGAMVETQERTVRKAVSVVINTCVSAGVSSEDMNRVAVAVGSAVLGMQSMGYTVSLFLACVNQGAGYNRTPWIVGAPINQNGAPLDISRLSAILRPWFFRRILFSVWETAPESQRARFRICAGGGYGHVGNLTKEDAQRITGDKDALIFDVNKYIGREDAIKRLILGAMGTKQGDK